MTCKIQYLPNQEWPVCTCNLGDTLAFWLYKQIPSCFTFMCASLITLHKLLYTKLIKESNWTQRKLSWLSAPILPRQQACSYTHTDQCPQTTLYLSLLFFKFFDPFEVAFNLLQGHVLSAFHSVLVMLQYAHSSMHLPARQEVTEYIWKIMSMSFLYACIWKEICSISEHNTGFTSLKAMPL